MEENKEFFQFEVLTGETPDTNALKNLNAIGSILSEFFDIPACTFVKNGIIFSAALGKSSNDAYLKAFDCDPISSFSAAVGFSATVDTETAKHLQSYAIPMIVAPDFEDTAIDILTHETNTILVKLITPLKNYKTFNHQITVTSAFGEICETGRHKLELNKDTFKVVTKTKPTTEQIEDAIFAWKISKHLHPINTVIAKDFKALSIFQAQANAQIAVEYSLNFACDNSKNAVICISENEINEGIIHASAQGRIGLIIYSGGEFNNPKINALADKYEIALLTTGVKLQG